MWHCLIVIINTTIIIVIIIVTIVLLLIACLLDDCCLGVSLHTGATRLDVQTIDFVFFFRYKTKNGGVYFGHFNALTG